MSGSIDPRAVMGAANNADLYALIFAAHGVPYHRTPAAFVGQDRPPPLFSDLVTLDPALTAQALEAFADVTRRSAGRAGMKDSFCGVRPEDHGLSTLFEATWIWHAAAPRRMPPGWQIITTDTALRRWEDGWRGAPATAHRQFPATLLDTPACAFLGYAEGDKITAGCLINHSADCAGLSNIFGTRPVAEPRDAALSIAAGKPLVGYEHTADLAPFQEAGFQCVGPLRILVPDTTKEPPHAS